MSKEIKKKIVDALMGISVEAAKSKAVKKAYAKAAKDLSKKINKAEKEAAKKAAKLQKIADEVVKIQELSKKPAPAPAK